MDKAGPLTKPLFLDFLRPDFMAKSVFLMGIEGLRIIIQSSPQAITQKSAH